MKNCFTFFIIFIVLASLHLNTGRLNNTVNLFSKIIKEVFSEKIICYISDKSSLNHLIEKALVGTEINILSISYNHLRYLKVNLPCTGYIVALLDANDFIKYYLKQRKNNFAFKPWTRLLLMYEIPPDQYEKLYRPVLNSAIDVILLDLLQQNNVSNFSKPFDYDVVVVTSLYKNATILTWRSNQQNIDWTKFRPTNWTPLQYAGSRRASLRVALFHCPPFMYVNDDEIVVNGLEYHVIREAIRMAPIKTTLIRSDAWNVALNMVEDNVSDVGACSQWFISSRGRNIDFTYPLRQISVTFLVKKPTLLPDSTFIFQPLQAPVYLVTVLILVLVLFGFTIANNTYRALKNINHIPDLVLQLLYLVRVLSMGGTANLPLPLCASVKLLLGFWYLYCVVFSTYYSAGLTSCLTNPRYTNNVDTLQQMVDSKIEWFSMDTELRNHFTSLNISIFTALANLHVRKQRVKERSETSAIAVKTIERRYVTDINDLPLEDRKYYKALSDSIGKYYIGFVLQKNSPLTRVFDETIFRLVESGVYGNWLKCVLVENDQLQRGFFSNYIEDPRVNINVKKMQGAFYLLVLGYTLSLISFFVEYIFGKCVHM